MWEFVVFMAGAACGAFVGARHALSKVDAPRGPDWRIVTPHSMMEGDGVLPSEIVNQMRSQGITVQTWRDGTGKGLPAFERNT